MYVSVCVPCMHTSCVCKCSWKTKKGSRPLELVLRTEFKFLGTVPNALTTKHFSSSCCVISDVELTHNHITPAPCCSENPYSWMHFTIKPSSLVLAWVDFCSLTLGLPVNMMRLFTSWGLGGGRQRLFPMTPGCWLLSLVDL